MKLMIVPARGGSKRVPDKNIRLVGKDPLVVRTLRVSLEAGLPTLFSTDKQSYIDIVRDYLGSKIDYELRPFEMARDNTRVVEEVFRICTSQGIKDGDTIGLMLPTSPFRSLKSLKMAIDKHKKTNKGIFSASKYGFPLSFAFTNDFNSSGDHIWKPIFGDESPMINGNTRSQNQNTAYHPTGGIYIFKFGDFKPNMNLYNNSLPIILDDLECIDIDSEFDFELACALAKKGKY
jgi:CMP-N-acetylneuraminic acid synthetase